MGKKKEKRKKEKSQRREIPEEIYFSFQPLFSSRWRRLRAKKWNTVGKDQAEETRGKCLLIRRETFVSAEKSSRLFVPHLFLVHTRLVHICLSFRKKGRKKKPSQKMSRFHSFHTLSRRYIEIKTTILIFSIDQQFWEIDFETYTKDWILFVYTNGIKENH